MAGFARVIRSLQLLLPSSGTEYHTPIELQDSVVPTFDFPPSAISVERVRMHQNNNPAVVTPQLFLGLGVHPPELTFPPDVLRGSTAAFISNQERYVEIIAMDVSHDSATARIVQMLLRSPEAQNVFVARWTNMAAVLAAGQPSGFEPVLARPTAGAGSDRLLPGHPLVIPPGWNLQMSGNTAGAAYSIFVSIAYIAHPISERRFYP